MNLGRVAGKFCVTPVYAYDQTNDAWVDTGVKGSLQTYDRFISERSFGQKKRILTTLRETPLPEGMSQIRVGDFLDVFLVEALTPDIQAKAYELIYSLRSARFHMELVQRQGQTRLSGVGTDDVEVVLETLWVDLERLTSMESRDFNAITYTDFLVSLPQHSQAAPGMTLRHGQNRYLIDEVYPQLDLPTAKVTRYD